MSADGELAVRLHHVRIGRTLSGMCQGILCRSA